MNFTSYSEGRSMETLHKVPAHKCVLLKLFRLDIAMSEMQLQYPVWATMPEVLCATWALNLTFEPGQPFAILVSEGKDNWSYKLHKLHHLRVLRLGRQPGPFDCSVLPCVGLDCWLEIGLLARNSVTSSEIHMRPMFLLDNRSFYDVTSRQCLLVRVLLYIVNCATDLNSLIASTVDSHIYTAQQ